MTYHLTLPKELERKIQSKVESGHYGSAEQAITETLRDALERADEIDALVQASGLSGEQLREDLDRAWDERGRAVDGESVFRQLVERSRALRAQGK